MKKGLTILSVILLVCACHRKTAVQKTETDASANSKQSTVPSVSYDASVKTIINTKCSPCHIPANGGFKGDLSTYAAAKENIDAIIKRIELNPGDPGFMPFKHDKLSADEIQAFVNWRDGGFKE